MELRLTVLIGGFSNLILSALSNSQESSLFFLIIGCVFIIVWILLIINKDNDK